MAIRLEKMSEQVIDYWCKKLKVDVSKAEVLRDKVALLCEQQAEHGNLADCDVCGAECSVDLPVCPFCGVGDDPKGEHAPTTPPPAAAATATLPAERTPKKPRKRSAAGKPEAPAALPTAIQKVSVTDLATAGITVEKLDAQIEQVNQLKASAVLSYWELGHALYGIFETQSWKLRIEAATEAPKYKSWVQFVQAELGFSGMQSYNLMEVSRAFGREDVQRVGVTKLSLVAKLQPADRKELLARLPSMSRNTVADEARRRAAAHGKAPSAAAAASTKSPHARSGEALQAALDAQAEARKKRQQEKPLTETSKVTVAQLLGKQTIPLFCKGADEKRAKRLADEPVGSEQLLNGVVVNYRVVLQAKGLVIVVERRREAE